MTFIYIKIVQYGNADDKQWKNAHNLNNAKKIVAMKQMIIDELLILYSVTKCLM